MAQGSTKDVKVNKPAKKQSFLVKTYLFSYNFVLVLG